MDQRLVDRAVAGLPPGAAPALIVRSPGRINLIGEHTDYTGGLVLPAAIDKALYFAVRRLDTPEWRLDALDIGQQTTLSLPLGARTGPLWADYLAGIGVQFQNRGHFLPGLEISFGGNIPVGSGMSSSAALEGGLAFALNELLNAKLSRPELAQICKASSNTYIGIPSGIMDQFASLNGRADGPLLLNCHTLDFQPVVSHIEGYSFVLVNSMVTHDLADSEYPQRVRECQEALEAIQQQHPELDHLSGAELAQLDAVRHQLSKIAYTRARYVIEENERVRRAVHALESGSAVEFGHQMNETHVGLRDEYEVSCEEIDFLQIEAVAKFNHESSPADRGAVAGARLMGGGFGGCTLNLVRTGSVEAFGAHMRAAYERRFGVEAEVYGVVVSGGTGVVG